MTGRFQCTRTRSTEWKKQLLDRAAEVFEKGKSGEKGAHIKELHAKIGQLTMESDFLSVAPGRIGEPSAKK